MATSQIAYTAGNDSARTLFGVIWAGQTFTTVGAITVTSIKLLLAKTTGSSPGTMTVAIRATTAGVPTGADLTSGTYNANLLGAWEGGLAWVDIDVTDYALSATTQYAIVVSAPSGTTGARVYWAADTSSPSYTDGTLVTSSDSGGTWSTDATWDQMFDVWGDLTGGPVALTGTLTGTGSLVGTLHIGTSAHLTGTLSGSGSITGTLTIIGGFPSSPSAIATKRLIVFGTDRLYYES